MQVFDDVCGGAAEVLFTASLVVQHVFDPNDVFSGVKSAES